MMLTRAVPFSSASNNAPQLSNRPQAGGEVPQASQGAASDRAHSAPKTEAHPAKPALAPPGAVNVRRIATMAATGVVACLPTAHAAPTRDLAQYPLRPLDHPFALRPEEGGWDCEAVVNGKITMRGTWRQTPEDQWGVNLISKMYAFPPRNNAHDMPAMEQFVSWGVTTQPFWASRWPVDREYEVQDLLTTAHAEDDHTFVWDLKAEAGDDRWTEQWVDLVDADRQAMVRYRYSNRFEGGKPTLRDTFRCRHW